MKKIVSILLVTFMLISLTACGSNGETVSTSNTKQKNTSKETDVTENSSSDLETSDTDVADHSNILVAYFSVTHTTEGVAKIAAGSMGADLYEITPEDPYTNEDIDYNDDNSRSTVEMNDPSARPAISGSVENMEQYDIVFIGYPIWWGEAPRILSTFMECYDFSGKTVVPFCTSGGSGIGSSADSLEALTNKATWLSGERFGSDASKEDVINWITGLGLDISVK